MNNRQLDMVLEYLDIDNEINLLINFDDNLLDQFININEGSIDNLVKIVKDIISRFIDFLNKFINFLKIKALLLIAKNFKRICNLIKKKKIYNKIKESTIQDDYHYIGSVNVPSIDLLEKAVDCMIKCVEYKKGITIRETYEKILSGDILNVTKFAEEIKEIDVNFIVPQDILENEEKYIGKGEIILNKLSIFLKKIVAVKNDSKEDFLAADVRSSKKNKKDEKALQNMMEHYSLSSVEYKNLVNFCVDVVRKILLYQYKIEDILEKFK